MSDKENLVSQWEKMGSSTGGMIGRIIGMAAENGLRALDHFVLTPLAQSKDQVDKSAAQSGVKHEETRASVWTEMGRQYGEKVGNAIGIAMDSTIEATKTNIVKPMEQATQEMTENQENPKPEL